MTTPINYNEKSTNIILEIAKTTYNEELDRFKQTEAKTSIALAFSGVIITAYFAYLTTYSPTSLEHSYLVYNYILKFVIMTLLVTSIYFLITSIRTDTFQQIDLNSLVDDSLAQLEGKEVEMKIAYTYKELVEINEGKIGNKIKNYNCGLKFMNYGFFLFIIYFIIEEIIKNV